MSVPAKKHKHEWLWWERKIRHFGWQGPVAGYERVCMERTCQVVQWVEELKPVKRPKLFHKEEA